MKAIHAWLRKGLKGGRSLLPPKMSAEEWAERAGSLLAGGISAHRVPEVLPGFPNREDSDITPDWGVVMSVWQLAETTGASRVEALNLISQALKSVHTLRERRLVLLAGPRYTAILVSVLPAVAWILGSAFGMNMGAMVSHVWGLIVILAGCALWSVGVIWLRAMYKKYLHVT